MTQLRVALIGRPNVGKSSLFNKLTRSRKSVVRNEPGVTRDILVEPCEWWGHKFDVIDTGGLTEDSTGFSPLIREQVLILLKSVDLLVVVMDARAGLIPEDKDVLKIAQESGKNFLMVVNKVDNTLEAELLLSEFYEVSNNPVAASFEQDFGIDKIVEWIIAQSPKGEISDREGLRLAVVGKPNSGKSSLCNLLVGENRMLVSDIAGTTVDAVEVTFEIEGKPYILVDTAGLRRSSRRQEGIERLSAVKTFEAIDRCEIALLMIDGVLGPSMQDARIVEYCLEQHKAIILVANKTDLGVETHENFREWFRDRVSREFHFFPDIPVVFVSAKTSLGMKELFKKIDSIYEKLHIRIPTSQLNKFFTEVIRQAPAPVYGTKDVKFYYLTQTHQRPPSFIAFANHPEGVTPSYRRFLSKRVAEQWGLEGVPIRIFVMQSRRKKREVSQT